MPLSYTLMLAWQDLVGVIAVLAFMAIGSILQKVVNKSRQSGSDARRQRGPSQAGEDETLEDMAARRRRELAQMGGARSTSAGGEPSNLSMQQMRQRALAKLEYEKRTAQLRQQQMQQAAQLRQQSLTPPPAARPAPPLRPAPTSHQQEALHRAQILARRRQEALRRQQAAQRQRAQRHPASARLASSGPSPGIMQLGPEHEMIDAGESVVHRHVPDALGQTASSRQPIARIGARNLTLSPALMRQAVILSEILAPPVSLREN